MSGERLLCPFFRVSDETARRPVSGVSNFARVHSRPVQLLRKAIGREPGHTALQGVVFTGPGYISMALDHHGRAAHVLVRLIDRDTGERAAEGWTDARTGLLTFEKVPVGVPFAVIAYLHRAKWRAEIWDGLPRKDLPSLTPSLKAASAL